MSICLCGKEYTVIVRDVANRAMRHILFTILLLYSVGTHADPLRGSIEISGSLYNPDWELRENATGMRLSGMWMIGENVRIRGSYNSADTDVVNLPIIRLRGLPFGNWREAGLGYLWQLSNNTSVEAELSYQGVELYDKIESGGAILAGINHRFGDRISGSLRLSYFDIRSADWRLTGDLYTALSERIDLVTRIDDTSKFDFTWYEVGLRFRF